MINVQVEFLSSFFTTLLLFLVWQFGVSEIYVICLFAINLILSFLRLIILIYENKD